MKIVWVTRSFLDYRLPVYKALNEKLNGNLFLIYNADYVPDRVHTKVTEILKHNAIGLRGEFKIGADDFGDFLANKKVRLPFQPKLIKTIKELEPDVILTDGFFQWTYAALWIKAFSKKTTHVMCYERTLHTERHAQWFRTFFRKFASKFIDSYCASGKLCGDYLQQLGVPESKITFGHMVADISGVSKNAKSKTKPLEGARTYLYVGKLIKRKGIKELLEGWKIFQDKKEDEVELLLVGDGPLKDFIVDFCSKNGINNVFLLGFVDYNEMSSIYSKADIFIIPTLEDNWSLVVPEAMANELPILCSVYNGCWPEYVQEKNGWVFDPLNRSDFVEKLETSYKCEHLAEFGKESKDIIKQYTPVHAAKAIINTIKISV